MKILTDIEAFDWFHFTRNLYICSGMAQCFDIPNFYTDFFDDSNYIEENACGGFPHELERIIISDHPPNLY